MNVIVSNKQSDVLFNLDLDVIKNVTGEYTANEIVEMFKNLFFDKLILDVTALKNYEDSNSYTFFKDNFDLNKIILFLPQDSTVCSPSFLSNFVKLGIYNFTTNVNGIKFLINKSNTYENVASLLQYSNTGATIVNENVNTKNKDIISNDKKHDVEQKKVKVVKSANKQLKIIGFINATVHAGSTSLIYMLQKELQKVYGKSGVVAIEVNRHDFQYFGNNWLPSAHDLPDHAVFVQQCSVLQTDGVRFDAGDPETHLFIQGSCPGITFHELQLHLQDVFIFLRDPDQFLKHPCPDAQVPVLFQQRDRHSGPMPGLDSCFPDDLAVPDHLPFDQADKHGLIPGCVDPVKKRLLSLRRIFAAFLRIPKNKLGLSGGNIQIIEHALDILILRAADQCFSAVLQCELRVLNNHLSFLLHVCALLSFSGHNHQVFHMR